MPCANRMRQRQSFQIQKPTIGWSLLARPTPPDASGRFVKMMSPYTIAALRRFPLWKTNFALAFVAGVAQGLGLSLFIPLLNNLSGEPDSGGALFKLLDQGMEWLGIPTAPIPLLTILTIVVVTSLAIVAGQRALLYAYSFTKYVHDIRMVLIRSLFSAEWKYSSTLPSGETVNNLVHESFRAARSLTHLVTAYSAVLQATTFVALSLLLSYQLVLLIAPLAVIAVLLLRPMHRSSIRHGQILSNFSDIFASAVIDYLRNLKRVKATGSEDTVLSHLKAYDYRIVNAQQSHQNNMAISQFIVQAIPVVTVSMTIGGGALWFDISVPELLVFLMFMARLAPLATQIQQSYHSYAMEAVGLEKVFETVNNHTRHKECLNTSGRKLQHLTDGISLENVSYFYPKMENAAIDDVSLTIKRGTTVGLVGGSGAGKSTLVDLMCSLRQPTSGAIHVDGVDLATFDLQTWRSKISYVSQETMILGSTIRDNLMLSNPHASEQDLANAINAAHFTEILDNLPDGLDSILGEGGTRLSGGQRQRLALAAALVGHSELLILDEATSALDNESEKIIRDTIDSLTRQMTIVVVAHRLTTLRNADEIHVMEHGKIVESGSYDDLMMLDGRFSELHEAGR